MKTTPKLSTLALLVSALFAPHAFADPAVSTGTYNAKNQLTGLHEGNGQQHGYFYNSWNLPSTYAQPSANTPDVTLGTTQLSYGRTTDLTKVIDARSLTTTYGINALYGTVSSLTSPDGGTATFTFDTAGNTISETRAGQTTTVAYDARNRPITVNYGDQTVSLQYPGAWPNEYRVTQATSPSAVAYWDYGLGGRPEGSSLTVNGKSFGWSLQYSNTTGQPFAATYTAAGQSHFLGYNNQGNRISAISITPGSIPVVNEIGYQPFGPAQSWRMAGSSASDTRVSRGYDTDGRVTRFTTATGTRSVTWDASNRVTQITGDDGYSALYSYDNLNRLTQAVETVGGISKTYKYAWDLNGNRTRETVNNVSFDYVVSATSNRLESAQLSGAAAGTTLNYTYDARGNILSDGVRTFTYNNAGQLTSVTTGGQTTTYAYNGLGQRVRKALPDGTSRYYLYAPDGVSLLGEYLDDGSPLYEVVWLDGLPVALLKNGNQIFYILTDHLGTPRTVKDSTGAVVWKWESDPFGNGAADELVSGTRFEFNMRFPGQIYDAESGLHYNNARYYDPKVGRYISSDPIGLASGINTYGYAINGPTYAIDPRGNTVLFTAAFGSVIGGAVGAGIAKINGTSVVQGALSGSIKGGLAGLTLGLAAPALSGLTGGSFFGNVINGAASGALGGFAGELGLETYEITAGSRSCYSAADLKTNTLLGAAGGAIVLRGGTSPMQRVVSWGNQSEANFDTTRWVIVASKSPGAYLRTVGPAISRYPYSNAVEATAFSKNLSYPSGPWGNLNGLVGQRIFKAP